MTRKKIRPLVVLENKNVSSKEFELFQNKTLRPILKMQHNILTRVFHEFGTPKQWNQMGPKEKHGMVKSQFNKNSRIRYLVIGVAVGQMTEEEFETFQKNSKEFSKRIIQMSIERIQSTIPLA